MIYKPFNKHYKRRLILALLLASFALPGVSLAAGRGSAASVRTKVNFCTAVDAFAEKLKKDIADNMTRFSTKEIDRRSALDDKITKQDSERQNTRFTWNNSRDKVYTQLLARATTDTQKTAIEKFRAAIDTAVETRRKSVDAATTTFKSAVDKGITERRISAENATTLFKSATEKALLDAKADCGAGMPAADARALYVTTLEDAQSKLQASLSQIKSNDAPRVLIKARQSAMEQAAKDFKTAVTKAENILKLAFPDA